MDLESDVLILVAAAVSCYVGNLICTKKKPKRKPRRMWAKEWHQRRGIGRGLLSMVNNELKGEDEAAFKNFIRLSRDMFENLLKLVEPHISKQDTLMRSCISARERLQTTLRFLATGESYRSLMYSTRIHESTISKFVPEVCEAIIKVLRTNYLKTPSSEEDWESIADQFESLWQFPHCLGALDGRHIKFRPPRSAGSYYYNYKGDHSIVLLALVDAQYRFTYVNIGVNGRTSDGGVFRESSLCRALSNNTLNIPKPKPLLGRTNCVPYIIVADEAFPLQRNILKPYPQRNLTYENKIFNYRLSRARRIVENAFGILANRFRVLLNPISLSPDKVEVITLTCVVLHNYLAIVSGRSYTDLAGQDKDFLDGLLERQGPNNASRSALQAREEFKTYFLTDIGKVQWQNEAIRRNNL